MKVNMNSNKIFSFGRFYLLMRNDFLLNYKKYLLTIAVAFVLGFIIIYLEMPKMEYRYMEAYFARRYPQIFIMCLLGLGAFVGSAFSELSSKVKTSNYLLLPASTFEKFLLQFVIRILLGTALFLFIFWADAHLARFAALSRMVDENNQLAGPEKYKFITAFHYSQLLIKDYFPPRTYWTAYEIITMTSGIFSIGIYLFSVKIFFRKMGLVKTIISMVALFYVLAGAMILFSHIFFPETTGFELNINEYVTPFGGTNNFELWINSICFFSWLFLLPLGYFKLKEKQV